MVVSSIKLCPFDADMLASAGCDGVTLWDLREKKLVLHNNAHGATVNSVAWLSQYGYVSGGDNNVFVVDIRTNTVLQEYSGGNLTRINHLQASKFGAVVFIGDDAVIHMWDVLTGQAHMLRESENYTCCAVDRGEGQWLVVGYKDRKVSLYGQKGKRGVGKGKKKK